jgi:hypothetical protein
MVCLASKGLLNDRQSRERGSGVLRDGWPRGLQ